MDHPIIEDLMTRAEGIVDEDARYAVEVEAAIFVYDNALSPGLYAQNLVFPMSSRTKGWFPHLNFSETRNVTAFEWAPNLTK